MTHATHACGAARLPVIATLLVMTTGIGCGRAGKPIGIPLRAKTQFQSEWQQYLSLPGEKALAVAGDLDGVYASGIAQGATSTEAAIAGALAWCEQRRKDRRIGSTCETYAVGSRRLGPAGAP
jgi:hypothetical protein